MARALLACHCGATPVELRFETLRGGKPFLSNSSPGSRPHFSLWHSRGMGLLGVTRRARLGVDLELVREFPEWRAIVRVNFAPSETHACSERPRSEQAFIATWARKEAFIKAGGEGLTMSLNAFEVEVKASAGSVSRSICGDAAAARTWTLRAWRLEPPMEVALAIPATNVTVSSRVLVRGHRV